MGLIGNQLPTPLMVIRLIFRIAISLLHSGLMTLFCTLIKFVYIQRDLLPRVYINGRKNLINRSLNNIIDNALKYGNKIEIKLIKENSNLSIIIDDDGSGIPEKEYENVFKPFYKIDKGRTESKSSVGLGLSIASDIVKSHGGNIVLNKSKMNGLSVKISLPV